ncbi:hypothetical protein KXX34_003677, partial [Aspergillus fumigatus]
PFTANPEHALAGPPAKTTPPYGAMCDNVPMRLEAYDCGPGAFMGIPVEIRNAVWQDEEGSVHEMYLIVPSR